MANHDYQISFENLSNKYTFKGWGDLYYVVPDLPGNIKVVHIPKDTLEITGGQTDLWEQEVSQKRWRLQP